MNNNEASTSNMNKDIDILTDNRNKLISEQLDWRKICTYHKNKYITCFYNTTGKVYHVEKYKQAIRNISKIDEKIEIYNQQIKELRIERRSEVLENILEKRLRLRCQE